MPRLKATVFHLTELIDALSRSTSGSPITSAVACTDGRFVEIGWPGATAAIGRVDSPAASIKRLTMSSQTAHYRPGYVGIEISVGDSKGREAERRIETTGGMPFVTAPQGVRRHTP